MGSFWSANFTIFIFFSILIQLSNEIQVPSSQGFESSFSFNNDNNNSFALRQNFYPVQFQFQYRPDFGGPWQNANWNRPTMSFSSKRPIVGIGSATPVNSVRFPTSVTSYYNSTTMPSSSGRGSSPRNEQSRDKNTNSDYKSTNSCKCGVLPPAEPSLKRITGGMLSKDNAWPWMAAIVYVGGESPFWFCGASLISDQYLITAAHCQRTMRRRGLPNIRILMGTNGIPNKTDKSNLYEIADLKIHPMYRPNLEEFDIGLIKLKKRVKFSDKISPICLTQKGSPFTNSLATVAGWGSIKYGDNPPESLREVELKVTTNTVCQREYTYHYGTKITNAMLCAWLPGKDSCQGDSGGPLFTKDKGSQQYTQIGVVSFGPPRCGETRIPGVYTRVASCIRWLLANTRDSTYCEGTY